MARALDRALGWRKVSRSALVVASLMVVVGCEDAGDPTVSQDASAVLGDAGWNLPANPGTGGGATAGGGSPGAGGSPDAGGTGGDAALPPNPGLPGAGRFDAGRPFPGVDASAPVIDAGPPAPVGDGGPDSFAEVRQVCVDTINMYRATRNLPALMRADPAREACSDEGAKYDGDINKGKPANQVVGHLSTMNRSPACAKVGFGSQDACPNWGVGARTGNATLADAIKKCLAQMWAEGEPPIPVEQCKMDRAAGGCFITHGHWINMTATNSTWVACGFYNVEGGTYWMNQDFDYRFR